MPLPQAQPQAQPQQPVPQGGNQDPDYQEYQEYLQYLQHTGQGAPPSPAQPAARQTQAAGGTAAIYAQIAKKAGKYDPETESIVGKVDDQLSPQGTSEMGAQALLPQLGYAGKAPNLLARLGIGAGVGAASKDVADQGGSMHMPNQKTVGNALAGAEQGGALALGGEALAGMGSLASKAPQALQRIPSILLDAVPGGRALSKVVKVAESLAGLLEQIKPKTVSEAIEKAELISAPTAKSTKKSPGWSFDKIPLEKK